MKNELKVNVCIYLHKHAGRNRRLFYASSNRINEPTDHTVLVSIFVLHWRSKPYGFEKQTVESGFDVRARGAFSRGGAGTNNHRGFIRSIHTRRPSFKFRERRPIKMESRSTLNCDGFEVYCDGLVDCSRC